MGDSRPDCGPCAASNSSTRVICAGHAFVQNVRRGHYELGSDADPKNRLTTAFTELAFAI
jgi:IS6 family transposase